MRSYYGTALLNFVSQRIAVPQAVERSLQPLLSSIVIPPDLIRLICDTEVGDAWIPAVGELDAKLGAIRSGPRIDSRKTLDHAAEALRLQVRSPAFWI